MAIALAVSTALFGTCAGQGQAQDVSVAVTEVPLQLRLGQETFGEILVTATPDTLIAASASEVADRLQSTLPAAVSDELRGLGEGLVPVDDIAATGVRLVLDLSTLQVVAEISDDVRLTRRIDNRLFEARPGDGGVANANFAMGVTFDATLDSEFRDDDDDVVLDFEADGFANFLGENGAYLIYSGDLIYNFNNSDDYSLARGQTLLFHDDRDILLRYGVGDTLIPTTNFGSSTFILGGFVERRYGALTPSKRIAASGARTLFLERDSTLEIVVNGVVVDRIDVRAGEVDLRDIPFIDEINEVEIFLIEEGGRRTNIDRFVFASNPQLLDAGVLEFSVAGGLAQDVDGFGIEYSTEESWIGAGDISYGFQIATVSAAAQIMQNYQFGGAEIAFGVPIGVVSVEGAASSSQALGSATAVGVGFNSGSFQFGETIDWSLDFSAQYRQENFITVEGRELTNSTDGGLESDIALRFGNNRDFSGSITGRFDFDNNFDAVTITPGIGLSYTLDRLTLSGSASYDFEDDSDDGLFAFLGGSYALGDDRRTRVSAGASHPSRRGYLNIRRSASDYVGDYGYAAGVSGDEDGGHDAFASGRYIANRAEVFASADHSDNGSGDSTLDVGVGIKTGFAFADGVFGIGRDPGNGFALVKVHESLDEANVSVGNPLRDAPEAYAGSFGPAVVEGGRPYTYETVSVRVEDIPLGYDIGQTEFETFAGAATGAVLKVGSAFSRSVSGVVIRRGEPLALASGRIEPLDANVVFEGAAPQFFSNREGRFFVGKLAPGRYRVALVNGRGGFEFSIAPSDPLLLDLGAIEVGQ